jgi:hypothetical protein
MSPCVGKSAVPTMAERSFLSTFTAVGIGEFSKEKAHTP